MTAHQFGVGRILLGHVRSAVAARRYLRRGFSRRLRAGLAPAGALGAALLFWGACEHDPYTEGPVCNPKETVPCYSGPAGTEGVGPCRAGYRECNPDREGFGECMHETTPVPETCATPEDDDCNGPNDEAADCQCKKGDTEPCYDGPAGTQDVGVCKTGEHACVNGLWPACDAQVVPGVEDCTNLVDEDCDGVACAAPVWGVLAGDSAEQRVTGVAADAAGDVYVAGYFAGTIDFGGQPLQSKGGADVFVAKLDGKGKALWSRSFATAADEAATAVAASPDGGVIVAGYFTADLMMGNTLLPGQGGSDAFVAKLDGTTGDVVWAVKRGYAGNQVPRALAVTAAGSVLVIGSFSGFFDCVNGACGFAAVESAGGMDAFVLELDPDGAELAHARFGGTGDDFAAAITLDGAGHAVIAGDFVSSVPIGAMTLATSGLGDRDVFVATLATEDLSAIEVLQLGDGAEQTATAATWTDGALVLAGTTAGVVSFPFATAGEAGAKEAFVAKLGDSAATSWARAFSGPEIEPAALAAGSKGRIAVAGTYGGSLDFGTGKVTDGGGTNAFLVQLAADGSSVWAKSFGKADMGALDEGTAVAVAPNGDVVFGGAARSAFDFGAAEMPNEVPNAGSFDAAVARFSP